MQAGLRHCFSQTPEDRCFSQTPEDRFSRVEAYMIQHMKFWVVFFNNKGSSEEPVQMCILIIAFSANKYQNIMGWLILI